MFQKTLARVEEQVRRVQNLSEALRECEPIIREELIAMAQQRFENSEALPGADPWAAIQATSWGRTRSRGGPAAKPLVDTGRLMRGLVAIVEPDQLQARYGNSVEYARVHQFGFADEVEQNVGTYTRAAHTRKAHTRGGYTRKDGRQVGPVQVPQHQVQATTVAAHTRVIQQNIPARPVKPDDETISRINQYLISYALYGDPLGGEVVA